jgi:hypothetical protein
MMVVKIISFEGYNNNCSEIEKKIGSPNVAGEFGFT